MLPPRLLGALVFLLAFGIAAASAADGGGAQTIVHVLDYVAVDYSGAVEKGQIKDEGEYKEMLEFTQQVIEQVNALPAHAARAELANGAQRLAKLVTDKAEAGAVADLARQLRASIIDAYNIAVTPTRTPDLARGSMLYTQMCASCHGAQGRGDGPLAPGMEPAPANFHDRERMAQRDRFSLYNTITLGVAGTPMRAFPEVSEDDRWALAYHVAGMAGPGQRGSPLVFARETLKNALDAYRKNEIPRAQQLAISAYLEGFELVEPALDAVDPRLRIAIEEDMLRLRMLIRDRAPVTQVEAHAARLTETLERAQEKLGGSSLSVGGAGVSAFIILMREGLEAILVLAAIIAFLIKAERRDALRYIHAGWIGALALGAVTWIVASYVISVSGAGREITEGVTALISTAILLYVGWWLHDKSHAHAWNQFIKERLAGALSQGTIWALASLSFLAVYREVFEMVLFYEALWAQAGSNAAPGVLGGFAAGAAALALIAALVFRYGVRLPIGLFFGVSSAFLAVLAVIFAGQGIGALQEAGAIDATLIDFPRIPSLGIFPTVQSLAAQVIVVAAIFAVIFLKRKENPQ